MPYIDKQLLTLEVVRSQQSGRMTDELAGMISLIANRYVRKISATAPVEDVVQDVLLSMVQNLKKLDPSRDCFGYITTSIRNAVRQQWYGNERQVKLKWKLWSEGKAAGRTECYT